MTIFTSTQEDPDAVVDDEIVDGDATVVLTVRFDSIGEPDAAMQANDLETYLRDFPSRKVQVEVNSVTFERAS